MDSAPNLRSNKSPIPAVSLNKKVSTAIKKDLSALDKVAKQAQINTELIRTKSNLSRWVDQTGGC